MIKAPIGKEVVISRSFSQEDVLAFAKITGDDNPVHTDKEYANKSMFKQQIVHGFLTSSMFSKIFGTIFPGHGGIYLSQSMKFHSPVYFDKVVHAKAEFISYDETKKRGTFKTTCVDDTDTLLISGEAVLKFEIIDKK